MGNTIHLKPISELLGLNFFIPSYQRGYRWDTKQVQELLDDIYDYAKKAPKAPKEFYCLQPIVVVKCDDTIVAQNGLSSNLDGNIWYEVIDGQQRLTTVRILFSYLINQHLRGRTLEEEYKKSLFRMDYETRSVSASFLDDIRPSKQSMDAYFISEAYDYIKQWFEARPQPREARESILRTLVQNMSEKSAEGIVQVIWYEISRSEVKPIDTFVRVNMGKIPLNSAELIKALFLQKRNFSDKHTAQFRQIEIANEWDRMEYRFQDENFWLFINNDNNPKPARIEFLFDMIRRIAEKKDPGIKKIIGDDQYSTFRYFSLYYLSGNSDVETLTKKWDRVKDYYQAFEEWFDDPIWHNYIGFLIYDGELVEDIYAWYRESDKSDFTKKLKTAIADKMKGIDCEKRLIKEEAVGENGIESIIELADKVLERKAGEQPSKKYMYEINLSYSERKDVCRLLLLYNIQYAVNQINAVREEGKGSENAKFPFERFKKEHWDVEHIDSFTPNPIETKATQVEWLRTSAIDAGDGFDDELKGQIIHFITTAKTSQEDFQKLYDRIVSSAREDHNDTAEKNNIGNLTLLDARTNRSYGNALFSSKRRIIIERDTEGRFIPPCTKNVFLKYYDKKGSSRTEWGHDDMDLYRNHIAETLCGFLKFKTSDITDHE